MVATLAGLTLSQAHDTAQARNKAEALQSMTMAWQGLLDPNDLDGSFPMYAETATGVINGFRAKGGKIAQGFYTALRGVEGASTPLLAPLQAAAPLTVEHATAALYAAGPLAIKKALASGKTLDQAMAGALQTTLGAASRHVQNAGREVVQGAVKVDPDAGGWSRVSGGNPCSFCAMLIGRGPVYKEETASFRSHFLCDCRAQPFFGSSGWTQQAVEFRRIWDEATYGKSGGNATNAFRRAYDERFPMKNRHAVRAEAFAYDDALNAAAKAKKAADAAAKAAAKETAKVKKWKGKPAPKAPTEPTPPKGARDKRLEDWHTLVNHRYDALGTGKPLSQSFNYSYVKRVLDDYDLDALDYLRANKYVDDDLYAMAKDAFALGDALDPEDLAAYKKALRSYRNLKTRHKRYLEEWREVNGITGGLQGMDGARTFKSNAEALDWATKHFFNWTNPDHRNALQSYTGSSYGPWNQALRDNANRATMPDGWEDLTRKADEALAASPAPEDLLLRRGTNLDEFAWPDGSRGPGYGRNLPPPDPKDLIGTVQTQHGYMSTSIGSEAGAMGGQVDLHVRVPQGHGAAFVDNISRYKGEREVILERSTNLFIHDVHFDAAAHKWIVDAEVIPREIDPSTLVGHPPMPRSHSMG